jgi:hypothetical protein
LLASFELYVDSHISPDGKEIVIFNPAQILPCYVVTYASPQSKSWKKLPPSSMVEVPCAPCCILGDTFFCAAYHSYSSEEDYDDYDEAGDYYSDEHSAEYYSD